MTRAAVNFNRSLTTSVHEYNYFANGQPNGPPNVYTNGELEWRMLTKQASTSTPPGKHGVHVLPTNYSCSWGRLTCSPGETYHRTNPSSGYTIVPDDRAVGMARSPGTLYSPAASLWNELEIKALNKLKNQDFHLGNFMGTADQTVDLFNTSAKRIAKGINKLPAATRRKAQKYAGRVPSKVPAAYLEYMYGWNPLMQDIVGACSSVDALASEGSLFQVKSKKSVSGSVETSFAARLGACYTTVPFSADNKVMLRYRLRNPLLARLSSLGLVNPLEIVWERVPYSFVVDWFVPIGNWLSALSGDFGYDFVLGCRSTFCTFTENGPTRVTYSPSTAIYRPGPTVSGKYGYFTRSRYLSSPIPGLYLKSPVSATHIAEALSLLATSFGR